MAKAVTLFEAWAPVTSHRAAGGGVRLARRSVDGSKPAPDRKVPLWGAQFEGGGLRVLPSGRRTFVVQNRNANGRTRRVMLGRYGVLTAAQPASEGKGNLVDGWQEGAQPA